MADSSYVSMLFAGLQAEIKRALKEAFDYVLTNLRFGHAVAGTRCENFQLYAVEGTTHETEDTEFSIAHGLGTAPYLLIPVLPLDTVNAEIVPLRVTRAADTERIYLASSVASAPIRVLLEA